jgi:hypothetical protein
MGYLIKVICCQCKRVLRYKKSDTDMDTHTYCEECYDKVMKEYGLTEVK